MGCDELKKRTKAFALRAIKLASAPPNSPVGRIIKNPLLRCGRSVGANYRAAGRAESTADFIGKTGTVEEETDESMYWMKFTMEADLMNEERLSDLYREADEILSMVIASTKTAKRRK